MSIELLDTARFYGFRVRRQIAGKTYQEYFSLRKDGKRLGRSEKAKLKASVDKRDAALAKMQKRAKADADKRSIFGEGGKVRGILFRIKTEKSGTRTPVFQIGIMSAKSQKIVNTTVSINMHGLKGAWEKAVKFYAFHKRISKQSATYKKLLRCRPTRNQMELMKRRSMG